MLRWVFATSILTICALAGSETVCAPARGAEKDFHDQDRSRENFQQHSLNKANFSGATLVGCNFTQASLKKANFKGAILTYATFYQADASEADFTGATAPGQWLRFSACNLNQANFEGLSGLCFVSRCSLKEANLRKSRIHEISYDCDLSRADLRGANLRAVSLSVTTGFPRFAGVLYDDDTAFPEGFDPRAAGMILKAGGAEKDFHDQDCSRRNFQQYSLNKANFSGATLVECNFTQASLKKANFKGAILTYATFYQADASEADFTGVTTPGQWLRFSWCNLNKANLQGLSGLCFVSKSSLKEVNLQKSKIHEISYDCDLSRADLRGANLRAVSFHASGGPRLTGALYDDDTAFPDGFDPKAAGMILKEADQADEKKEDKK